MKGKPTVAGTRITVELILDKLAAGETIEQQLQAHPRLTQRPNTGCPRLCVQVFEGRRRLTLEANGLMNVLVDERWRTNFARLRNDAQTPPPERSLQHLKRQRLVDTDGPVDAQPVL